MTRKWYSRGFGLITINRCLGSTIVVYIIFPKAQYCFIYSQNRRQRSLSYLFQLAPSYHSPADPRIVT